MIIIGLAIISMIPFTPILLAGGLGIFVLGCVYYIIMCNLIPSIVGITFLLIYLGRMMIISCYACAVLPNIRYSDSGAYLSWVVVVFGLVVICGMMTLITAESINADTSRISSVGSYLFSRGGVVGFGLITILLVAVLHCSSTLAVCYCPLRAI